MAFLFDHWPEHVLPQEECQKRLAPFAGLFVTAWRDAWGEWEALSPVFRNKMQPTTRAGILHNLVVFRVKELFAGKDGIEFCEKLGFFKMYIGEVIVVRLKRLGRDHLAKNIR